MEESLPALLSEPDPIPPRIMDSVALKPKPKPKTNPNKINQWTGPDPRQAIFFANYFDPKSSTFANCLQSAKLAGFSDTYAANLLNLMPDWLSERLESNRHMHMLALAERNFQEMLEMSTTEKVVVKKKNRKGEVVEKEVEKHDAALLRIKKDVSEFISETIGKSVYNKQIKTGGSGARINFFTQINNDRGAFDPNADEESEA